MLKRNFYLTDKEINELVKLSKQTGLSMAELIRRAIDKYVKSCRK